jgi:hypothetical protein
MIPKVRTRFGCGQAKEPKGIGGNGGIGAQGDRLVGDP